jgi:hypothetical protein
MSEVIAAEVVFYAPEEGGRDHPLDLSRGEYTPHLSVEENSEYLGVRFLPSRGVFETGEPLYVKAELIYPNVDYSALTPGAHFKILEGPNTVGQGRVTSRWREAT